ncbi:hypothetical protein VN97_g2853 [Penicillium thymicola]|uniref:Uncharacterized protein n=1 Tax=Penicillium thymicola TaxID=293382 RepID=A0AAI9TNU5_PENTH|nr:hypothetical protein VN97_g2853 [Penicillium thymicola]
MTTIERNNANKTNPRTLNFDSKPTYSGQSGSRDFVRTHLGSTSLTNRGARQLAETDITVTVKCYRPSTTSPAKQ